MLIYGLLLKREPHSHLFSPPRPWCVNRSAGSCKFAKAAFAILELSCVPSPLPSSLCAGLHCFISRFGRFREFI